MESVDVLARAVSSDPGNTDRDRQERHAMGFSHYPKGRVRSLIASRFAGRKKMAGRRRWGRTLRVEGLETREMLAFSAAGVSAAGGSPVSDTSIDIINLNSVDFIEKLGQNPSGGNVLWYGGTASRNGYLTVDAVAGSGSANVQLTLYQGATQLTPLRTSTLVNGHQRIDWQMAAGEAFVVQLSGTAADVDLRLANLLTQSGDTVALVGTAADDSFEFFAAASPRIIINGIAYGFDAAEAAVVTFDGAAGDDTATLHDSDADEVFAARPGWARLAADSGAYSVEVVGVSTVHAYATAGSGSGNGGADEAWLYDSSGDDTFIGTPDSSRMFGDGKLMGNGNLVDEKFFYRAKSFETVHAYARPGGRDVAVLLDSDGDDTLSSTKKRSELTGQDSQGRDFRILTKSFYAVSAYALAGGDDTADLWGSVHDDQFQASPDQARIFENGSYSLARYFDTVHAWGNGGDDVADMTGSAGDDVFVRKHDETGKDVSRLYREGLFHLRAKDFDEVNVDALGGANDTAELHDSPGDDFLAADLNSVRLLSTDAEFAFMLKVVAFEQVVAKSSNGGLDDATLASGVTYVDLQGDWQ
jgi:hypothetical protein